MRADGSDENTRYVGVDHGCSRCHRIRRASRRSGDDETCSDTDVCLFVFFCIPQLYLWGSPLLGEIFAYVTVF